MPIVQYADGYYLECDDCGEKEGPYDAWDDALDMKQELKRRGWESVKDKHNNWADKCPKCSWE